MLLLGLLFIIVAAAVTAGAVYDGGDSVTFEIFGTNIDTTVAGVFLAGVATMIIFFLGIWLCFSSAGRARRKRAERKEARNRQKDSVSQLEQERAKLRAENERLNERLSTRDPAAVRAGPTDADTTESGTVRGTTAGTAAAAGAGAGAAGGSRSAPAAERPTSVEGDRIPTDSSTRPGSSTSAESPATTQRPPSDTGRTGATGQTGRTGQTGQVTDADLRDREQAAGTTGRHRDDT